MNKMDVSEKVIHIIKETLNKTDPGKIVPDSEIIRDLGADSLDCMEMVMCIEDAFDIDIPDEFIPRLKTVKDVIGCVENVCQ